MKSSKVKPVTFLLMFLILLSTFLIILPKISLEISVKGDPDPPVLQINAPQTVTVSGPEDFNISLWLSVSESINLYTYQVKMTVDDAIMSLDVAWTPTQNSSWVFYGLTNLPIDPFTTDNDGDGSYESITMGSTLIGGIERVIEDSLVLLAIINVRVVGIGTGTLSVDNQDTFLLTPDMFDIDSGRQDTQVTIEGNLPTEPSTITIDANPTSAITGQTVTISGSIIPDRPGVDVKIEQRSATGGQVWRLVTEVQTDETSQYEYNHTFDTIGNYKIKTSWAGDETYKPATSEIVNITIREPYIQVNIWFADGREDLFMGDVNLPPPTEPETFNVTVTNATDLYSWKFKIGYDPKFVTIDDIWLPADNVLELTGSTYNFSFNIHSDHILCEATINQTGQGYTGNGTLFQFNVTGFAGTFGVATILTMDLESNTRDSEGSLLLFRHEDFYFEINAAITATIRIVDPITGESEFNFRSNETIVGAVFNASIIVENATNIYGFSFTLTFNNTLLNVTKMVQPLNDPLYVFYNKNSTTTYDWMSIPGTVTLEDRITDEEPFSGNGIIAIIEFQIRMVTTNTTLILETALNIGESAANDGIDWRNTPNEGGHYTFTQIVEGDGDGGVQPTFLEAYGLYLVVLVIIAIISYLVYRRLRPKQIQRRPARIVYRA